MIANLIIFLVCCVLVLVHFGLMKAVLGPSENEDE